MEELARLAREHDFAVVVTYTPSAYTAYGDMATFDDASIELTMRNYSNLLRAYFARRAGSLGFLYLDLTPALATAARESSEENLLYFRTNVHFTPTGHDIVARQIAPLVAKAIGAEETNRR